MSANAFSPPPSLGLNGHNEQKCKFFSPCIQRDDKNLTDMSAKNVSFLGNGSPLRRLLGKAQKHCCGHANSNINIYYLNICNGILLFEIDGWMDA